jgi:hypothetical protein
MRVKTNVNGRGGNFDGSDRSLDATLNQRLKEALYWTMVYQDHNTPPW